MGCVSRTGKYDNVSFIIKTTFYFNNRSRNAVIHKCHDTRVVLGPVTGRIRLSECRNTVVVCAARSMVIADCRGVVVHTLTPQRPILVGGRTQGITVAPLNIYYTKLKQHMMQAQLQSHINMWNRPLHLGKHVIFIPRYVLESLFLCLLICIDR